MRQFLVLISEKVLCLKEKFSCQMSKLDDSLFTIQTNYSNLNLFFIVQFLIAAIANAILKIHFYQWTILFVNTTNTRDLVMGVLLR